jgi:hypothetical protein
MLKHNQRQQCHYAPHKYKLHTCLCIMINIENGLVMLFIRKLRKCLSKPKTRGRLQNTKTKT